MLSLLLLLPLARAACPNFCSGHGTCGSDSTCVCFHGWSGSLDCSSSMICLWPFSLFPLIVTCPNGISWVDRPSNSLVAHHLSECSGVGVCDRASGTCECYPGYAGNACQRSQLPTHSSLSASHHLRDLPKRLQRTRPMSLAPRRLQIHGPGL
jgi:hypothetical protein